MVLTMMLSLCSLFTVQTSAASLNRKYAVANMASSRLKQTFTTSAYWGKKELTFSATASDACFIWGCSRSDVISYVEDYARFTVRVTRSDGYSKKYTDLRIGDTITLPWKWGRSYTITVESYYQHGGFFNRTARDNATAGTGLYMLST
jgi:hypothetical protein